MHVKGIVLFIFIFMWILIVGSYLKSWDFSFWNVSGQFKFSVWKSDVCTMWLIMMWLIMINNLNRLTALIIPKPHLYNTHTLIPEELVYWN